MTIMVGFIGGVCVGAEFINTPFGGGAFVLDLVIVRIAFIYGDSNDA